METCLKIFPYFHKFIKYCFENIVWVVASNKMLCIYSPCAGMIQFTTGGFLLVVTHFTSSHIYKFILQTPKTV